MKKKTVLQLALASVCATALLVAGVAFAANAEPLSGDCGADGDNVKWEFNPDSGELRIYGEGKMEDYSSDYYSDPAPWYDIRSDIVSVNIESGVTSIGEFAFCDCDSLTDIIIPNGVTSIGDYSFSSCGSLTNMTIPQSVTSIGENTFFTCENLTKIEIPSSVTSIGDRAFSCCSNLTYIALPNNLMNLGIGIFASCRNLTSITIPDGVTSIGDSAFSGCWNLTDVTIPESVKSIGKEAFGYCNSLTNITIPNSVTSIGECAFSYCHELKKITVAEDNPNYFASGNCLIEKESGILIQGFNSSEIPTDGSVTGIGDFAFWECAKLNNIIIPDGVVSIGISAFDHCTNLTEINIPDSVTSIGNYAFEYCNNVTEITIPKSVKFIGKSVPYGCYNLKTVYIDSTDIAQDAEMLRNSYLLAYADTVYINSAITEISDSIPAAFPYTHTAVHDGAAYTAYSKNPTVHDTLEGYIQFRPGDGVYDARLLVEGKSDFMEDYASATVTLTFTKNDDSGKTMTMTALADQAYTSVTACGQRKDARPGYGFIGLVVKGIGNADVGSISASVTLTSADGDTVTYALGSIDRVPERLGDYPVA